MPVSADIRLAAGDHVVHFYDGEDELAAIVAGSLGAALADGQTVILIATHAHCELLGSALREAWPEIDWAGSQDRLVALDAQEALARLMVDGMPDPAAFDASVGSIIHQALESGHPVCAYGEMVALLWEAGQVVAAIELERLWNALAAEIPSFSLLCAYRMPESRETIEAFSEVCGLHSEVVGGGPILEHAELSCRLPRARHAPRHARRFVADSLASWDRDDLVDDAMVIVSELATNAVTHARSGFSVSLARIDGFVRIAVGDAEAAPPERRPSHALPGGHGLALVDALATRWGHTAAAGGKLVWADLTS